MLIGKKVGLICRFLILSGVACFQKGIISLSIDFMPLICNLGYVCIVLVDTEDTVPQSFRNVGYENMKIYNICVLRDNGILQW